MLERIERARRNAAGPLSIGGSPVRLAGALMLICSRRASSAGVKLLAARLH
jgi:hypothetical protein